MIKKIEFHSPEKLAKFCSQTAEDRKAEDVAIIKLGNLSLIADYLVICTGTSYPHLKALADWIRKGIREQYDIRPMAIDGKEDHDWVVIDFGTVVVHLFSRQARERYKLEQLWGDAKRIAHL